MKKATENASMKLSMKPRMRPSIKTKAWRGKSNSKKR